MNRCLKEVDKHGVNFYKAFVTLAFVTRLVNCLLPVLTAQRSHKEQPALLLEVEHKEL